MRKAQNHRIAFSDVGLIENYLRKELCILVHFRTRDTELLALFESQRNPWDTDPTITVPLIGDGRKTIYCGDATPSHDKHIVLVRNVKAMEPPERVIPSMVWVDSPDSVYSLLPHALYFVLKSGFALRGSNRIVENWELSMWGDDPVLGADESASQMVKGCPEVVNSVAQNAPEIWRDRVRPDDLNNWIQGIGFDIYPNVIRPRINVAVQTGFEITDVLFGPLDFLSHS